MKATKLTKDRIKATIILAILYAISLIILEKYENTWWNYLIAIPFAIILVLIIHYLKKFYEWLKKD